MVLPVSLLLYQVFPQLTVFDLVQDFLFHVFFPITYPLDSLRYRKAQCALVGNPPFFPPGRQLGDYLERTLVHSVRGFRRHVRKYSSTAWLPSELCHIIVDLCGDDIRTLKTLSVVSSLWTHRTRIYLFQYIRATRHEAYHLAKTLSSPCSTLNTIQRLHIVDEHYWYLIPSILDQLARANVLVEFLELSTHRLLKNVKFARIQRIRTRHLRMRCRPYHDELINDALRFACAFPGLESLSVTASHNFEIMSPPTSAYTLPQEVLRFPTNLRSLSIQMLSPLKLASWLMDNHWYAMEHLVSLELLSGAGKDDEYLFRYQRGFESQREDLEKFLRGLEMLGPQLQHFGITIGKHGDGLRRGCGFSFLLAISLCS